MSNHDRVSQAIANAPYVDEDPAIWAVRAAGIIGTMVYNPDPLTKEQIIDFLEQLFTMTPTVILAAASIEAQRIADEIESEKQ